MSAPRFEIIITDDQGDTLRVIKVEGIDPQLCAKQKGSRESVINLSAESRRALIMALL
jgi:hypothetical protein